MPKKYRHTCKHCHQLPKVRPKQCTSGGIIKVVVCNCAHTPNYFISYAQWMREHAVGSDPIQLEIDL